MMTKSSSFPFFLLFLSSFAFLTHHRKALCQNFDYKFKGSSYIDLPTFEEILHANEHYIFPQEGMKERDQIDKLPGQPHVKFNQYGGYVTINQTDDQTLYYYFVEARKHKDYLPLLLWLNGGPGCSSLGIGAMQELGPFRVHSDGKSLYKNPFAWNHVANLLFLESPAGVGFSYSNTSPNAMGSGDKKTVLDNYIFLLNWLERFPEYKDREFYIAGEGYAGHYISELAYTILDYQKLANKTLINLKGVIIGNAALHDPTDWLGMYEYWAGHALISKKSLIEIRKHCNFLHNNKECTNAVTEAENSLGQININNIYAPLCSSNLNKNPKKTSVMKFDACTSNYVDAYLNRPEVQNALHANVTKVSYKWELCSHQVFIKWEDKPTSVIPLLQDLTQDGIRVWIYSGDVDGNIPVTATMYSIAMMNLPLKTPWYPWFLNGEVGGYTEVYKGDLTFATVRGAGHEVPSYSPQRALSLIKHFLNGISLPN